ncbi:WD40 repeat-like protein [Aspergillus candidus]|uniref:WD40 repeat-like protein n=1 Tax=Aspergillus candidus TaxID=41067 RepID=A0A2I2FC86_ASPCN|nr:WD40 repeat-like protein [Aspergillus candidus]PLB38239.1 WD40 repeat-like protein [Aspergillus candidus]
MNGLRAGDDRTVPTRPFRILDAPNLRDDFYSSTLAYSATSGVLAVGLGNHVYLWSEAFGVQRPPLKDQHTSNYVTSLSFSSENGSKSILAIGKRSGMLCLWSVFEPSVRFRIDHPDTITCVAFKQTKSRRPSERFPQIEVDTEDLAVGDDNGFVWYYSVEWSDDDVRAQYNWHGSMTLLVKISAHSQQICGIVWSPDGSYLATGGNDNTCLLFELEKIMPRRTLSEHTNDQDALTEALGLGNSRVHSGRDRTNNLLPLARTSSAPLATALLNFTGSLIAGEGRTTYIPMNCQKHRLSHSAAVKAIAFAPWRPSLLATGGGSNDRAIHFYHTPSGACLATINVFAQVTSLIWSKTRRQIVATFGFAQPEHPFRIAVFAWPSCEQIAAIPWGPHGSPWDGLMNNEYGDCGRALSAVSYPGRPPAYMLRRLRSQDSSSPPDSSTILERLTGREQSDPGGHVPSGAAIRPRAKEGGLWCSRTTEEGCIIVASSDQTLKFHEVWTSSRATIEGTEPTTPQTLTLTVLNAQNNHSTLECWALVPGFERASEPGISGTASLSLGALSGNASYTMIPPRFDGGLHNAPGLQWVIFLSGLAHITLPHSEDEAWIRGGERGTILVLDTRDVSAEGHFTEYTGDEVTVAVEVPVHDVPGHRVLHGGACGDGGV